MRSLDVPGVGRVTLADGEPCPPQWQPFDTASTRDQRMPDPLPAAEAAEQAERYVDLAKADGVDAEAADAMSAIVFETKPSARASARRSR